MWHCVPVRKATRYRSRTRRSAEARFVSRCSVQFARFAANAKRKNNPGSDNLHPACFCLRRCRRSLPPPHGAKAPSQLRIVFDPENGNGDDYVGASLHQPCQRFFGIRFRKDDQRHDRMTKNFDPPLESHEWKIRPGNGNETVEQKNDEPAVVQNNF